MPAIVRDFDADVDAIEDVDASAGVGLRPHDRVMTATTIVALPVPVPNTTNFVFAAQGEIVMCQTHPDGPRVMGTDALPTGRHPFFLGRIDDASAEMLKGFTVSNQPTYTRPSQALADYLDQQPRLISREVGWPVSVYSTLFNTRSLIQE